MQLPHATGIVQPATSLGQNFASSTAAVAIMVLPVPVFHVTHCRLLGLNQRHSFKNREQWPEIKNTFKEAALLMHPELQRVKLL